MDIDTKESSIKNVIGKPNTYNMIRLEKNKPKVLYIAIAEWIYVTGRAAKRIFGPQAISILVNLYVETNKQR
jgi:hypothetical protein